MSPSSPPALRGATFCPKIEEIGWHWPVTCLSCLEDSRPGSPTKDFVSQLQHCDPSLHQIYLHSVQLLVSTALDHLPSTPLAPTATIMSWRSQGITGSNNIPLGKARRFGGDAEPENDGNDVSNGDHSDHDLKRGRSPEPRRSPR